MSIGSTKIEKSDIMLYEINHEMLYLIYVDAIGDYLTTVPISYK